MALKTAINAAKAGSKIALKYHSKINPANAGSNLGIKAKLPRDYVTQADLEVQKTIKKIIGDRFPEHGFIGEEDSDSKMTNEEYIWVIDPIDGTAPFIHGREHFGTIISLISKCETVLGVMYMPLLKDLYTAIKGRGAFVNSKPALLRKTKNMDYAILCTNTQRRSLNLDGTARSVPIIQCVNTENYGCAIYEFGLVLKGQNDGCYFFGPKIWDVAAGCLMINEAGGKARYEFKEPGNMRSSVLCAASTKPIFNELEEFVFGKLTKIKN